VDKFVTVVWKANYLRTSEALPVCLWSIYGLRVCIGTYPFDY